MLFQCLSLLLLIGWKDTEHSPEMTSGTRVAYIQAPELEYQFKTLVLVMFAQGRVYIQYN